MYYVIRARPPERRLLQLFEDERPGPACLRKVMITKAIQ